MSNEEPKAATDEQIERARPHIKAQCTDYCHIAQTMGDAQECLLAQENLPTHSLILRIDELKAENDAYRHDFDYFKYRAAKMIRACSTKGDYNKGFVGALYFIVDHFGDSPSAKNASAEIETLASQQARIEELELQLGAADAHDRDLTAGLALANKAIVERDAVIAELRAEKGQRDVVIADLKRANQEAGRVFLDENAKVRELERITGPVLRCCGRRAVEHTPSTLFAVPHYLCKSGMPIISPPEYTAWLKERDASRTATTGEPK
jgi:hypothetical protein